MYVECKSETGQLLCPHARTHTHTRAPGNPVHSTDIAVPRENSRFCSGCFEQEFQCSQYTKGYAKLQTSSYVLHCSYGFPIMAVQTNGKHVLMHTSVAHHSKD